MTAVKEEITGELVYAASVRDLPALLAVTHGLNPQNEYDAYAW